MNQSSVHDRIRILIEDTNDAYFAVGHCNTDYAEFASMALGDFKDALKDPSLTARQLRKLLRTGMSKHKDADPAAWSVFMARHLSRAANAN